MLTDAWDQLLFVYGLLKRGQPNHAELRRARFVRTARTKPAFALHLIDGFPALVPGGLAVHGELYRIATLDLVQLDEFEGSAYLRQVVELETGEQVLAYLARVPSAGVLLPGDEWPIR